MSGPPDLIEVHDFPGDDYVSRWKVYQEHIYQRYICTLVKGGPLFRGLKVHTQRRPETNGKHYGFWHMIQEGSGGRSEQDRTIDLERCRRVEWIAWVIQNADKHPHIRVFRQTERWGEKPWALWLYQYDYLVILWERKDYYLLKTAFYGLKKGKLDELERDWKSVSG